MTPMTFFWLWIIGWAAVLMVGAWLIGPDKPRRKEFWRWVR